jgi:hypothetical protein
MLRALLVVAGSISLLIVLGKGSDEFEYWHVHPVKGTNEVLLEPLFGCKELDAYKSRFEHRPEKSWTPSGWENSTAEPGCRAGIFVTGFLSIALKCVFVFITALLLTVLVKTIRLQTMRARLGDPPALLSDLPAADVERSPGLADPPMQPSDMPAGNVERSSDLADPILLLSSLPAESTERLPVSTDWVLEEVYTSEDDPLRKLLDQISKFFSRTASRDDPHYLRNDLIMFNMVKEVGRYEKVFKRNLVLKRGRILVVVNGDTLRRAPDYGLSPEKTVRVFLWLASLPGKNLRGVVSQFIVAHDMGVIADAKIRVAEKRPKADNSKIFDGFLPLVDVLRSEAAATRRDMVGPEMPEKPN